MMENLSVGDALALRGENNTGFGNGDNGFIWVVLLFFLFMNNGFGQNGFGGAATAAAQNEILLGQNFDRVQTKLDGIGQGICDSTFALNNSIKDCCCNTQLGIANLGANIDRQTCAITTAVHAEGEATRNLIQQNEMQTLRDKVQDLQVGLSQCRQNEYLVGKLTPPCPIPAYAVPNPNCCYNGCCGGGYQPNI